MMTSKMKDHQERANVLKPSINHKTKNKGNSPLISKPNVSALLQRNMGNRYIQALSEHNDSPPFIQRKCACGGTCASCSAKEEQRIQAKLKVGASNDRYEKEADYVASQIMRMPDISRQNEEEEEEELIQPKIQRVSSIGDAGFDPGPDFQLSRSGGQALSDTTRQFMEPRFGTDFGNVRVHAGLDAQKSAAQINARAFTSGNHIWLGERASESDKTLMAHELTHVIQQGGKRADMPEHSRIQRLGNNPGCSNAERATIHQAIFNARGWLNKAIPLLEANPLSRRVTLSLRRNFGPTYGVSANAPLIVGRLRSAYRAISTIPFRCAGVADATCATGACGYAFAGSRDVTICRNATLTPGSDWRYQAGCVLHESLHARFSRFTVDEYSGWHGASGSTPTYPGAGTDPLLNADSYTTLAMDLS